MNTCGLPFTIDVAAIVLNVTVTQPAAAGYITVFPADAAPPLASSVNFTAGADVANNATLKISQANPGGEFKIFSLTNVHVVGDVVGYYAQPVATALECINTTPVTNPINAGPLNGVYYAGAIAGACTTGYTHVSTSCWVNNASASSSGEFGGPGSGQCAGNSNVNTHTVSAARRCCRIPGR